MAISHNINMPASLRRRLLDDIADIQRDPYPNVHMIFSDDDIYKACLILTPDDEEALHLTVQFPRDYPLRAPTIAIQSRVVHPNVFGSYICATILNTEAGWTSAYTLKGIAIQLLSFFSSDSLEQDYGGGSINIKDYRNEVESERAIRNWVREPNNRAHQFSCQSCGFGTDWEPFQHDDIGTNGSSSGSSTSGTTTGAVSAPGNRITGLLTLPDELLLRVLDFLDVQDISALERASPRIRRIVISFDFIRLRELQCFCLKQSFMRAKLGIGVAVSDNRRPVFSSEFDLISQEAFYQHRVRRSIQGVPFQQWLPLPINRRHWNSVRTHSSACLKKLHTSASMQDSEPGYADVLYYFMNNVVVQFSAVAERGFSHTDSRSTLSHASEKAVEAYFSLFHLLLCIATEDQAVVVGANRVVARFLAGPRTKAQFPDLGHVLVAALISDDGLTQDLTFTIIKEAILRNVVWMLDAQGAGMAELAYLEPSAVSDYRLLMTFHASRTSYRLLMFLKLFSAVVRQPGKSLVQLRDALFDTHGGPPPGTSATMSQQIRNIHSVDGFPKFLKAMGLTDLPSKTVFTAFLRRTITDSVDAGYSRLPLSQSQLYMIRRIRERNVEKKDDTEVTPDLERWFNNGEKWYDNGWRGRPSFFPGNRGSRDNRGDGDGGRGSGRGRGHGRGRGRGGY